MASDESSMTVILEEDSNSEILDYDDEIDFSDLENSQQNADDKQSKRTVN